jgi:undecaprenyl diphosphate synthase
MQIENLKFNVIGDIARLPEKSQEVLSKVKKKTENNTGITLTIALIYGGQDEIVRATKKIIAAGIDPESLDEEVFRSFLDTASLPPIDMIVRTGGDIRHSGFLLYDSAYSEYYFTEKKWPEFDQEELEKVLEVYSGAKRNF